VRISFLVNHVHNGWEPTDTRLGGTEESVVRWAEELVTLGHDVFVYRNERLDKDVYKHNGVWYKPRELYAITKSSEAKGVTVNVKSFEQRPLEPTVYVTNETDASELDLSGYDAVVWPSEWAKRNIPVNNGNVLVVPHGYDPSAVYPGKKVAKQCLYASSPDRGLETLERIWPSIVEQHPDAQLVVTYGGRIDTPNTTCVGEVSEEEMNELYQSSDIWVHPCSGGELFGITAIKAQASGCVPVYFPTMALAETVKVGVKCSDARDMYIKLIQLLGNDDKKEDYRKQLKEARFVDWKESTNRLLSILEAVIQ